MNKTPEADAAYAEALDLILNCATNRGRSLEIVGLGLLKLPPEVAQLTALETLWLNDNQLTTLPPEVGRLTNLRSMFLMNNQLTTLPRALKDLPNLRYLFLHGNPSLELPAEILGADPEGSFSQYTSAESILNFYYAREQGSVQ